MLGFAAGTTRIHVTQSVPAGQNGLAVVLKSGTDPPKRGIVTRIGMPPGGATNWNGVSDTSTAVAPAITLAEVTTPVSRPGAVEGPVTAAIGTSPTSEPAGTLNSTVAP